jgi:uncharacterized protein (TIGR02300 family)
MSESKPAMTDIKLGNKYDCFNCGAKFYDLGKGTSVCPKCGADQKDAGDKNKPLMSQAVRRRRRAELAAPEEAEVEVADAEVAAIDGEDELVVADLDLGADEEEEEDEVDEEV